MKLTPPLLCSNYTQSIFSADRGAVEQDQKQEKDPGDNINAVDVDSIDSILIGLIPQDQSQGQGQGCGQGPCETLVCSYCNIISSFIHLMVLFLI